MNMLFFTRTNWVYYPEEDLDGGAKGALSPFFLCNHLFFCNHFWELQTVLIEVKMISNNAPLIYFYPNTIKTCSTPNHLMFGRHILYYSNTSTVVRNLTILSSTTDKINRISNHFWLRWRHEYVVNLREKQQTSKLNTNSKKIIFCQFMIKRRPDTFGKLP